MTEEIKESVFKEVDLNCLSNNTEHHTNEISKDQLIVRRGQSFNLTLKLTEPFTPELHPLSINAITGRHPSEDLGTASFFGIPDHVERSPSAKAVWKVELVWSSLPMLGILNLKVTPPADAPIGEYILSVKYRGEETLLAMLVMLFNPWCPDDSVFLLEEPKRQEYVMNEEGIIYQGSGKYIIPLRWDFGQFDSSMVDICMKILDLNPKHLKDPADDVSARCNPIYVSRVISAMVNSEDDRGVVEGRWEGSYRAGFEPSHWSGSLAILKMWLKRDCHPVKYGQCWVYAGVMVSVMRFLGIPCRPITNYQSAHDCNANLIIDEYYADYGVREKPTHDSIWNYHVWVEGWMKRPDLSETGKYDGWQVLDPTPQEKSDGVYCCGPASVEAIRSGRTDLKYDVPFVFAEVNADCVDWLVKADGSLVRMWTDTKTVGQNISTKAVGSDKRQNVTRSYKQEEGTEKEREIYEYARTRDYKREDEKKDEDLEPEDEAVEEDKETPDHIPAAEEDKETPDHIPTVEEDKETALDNVPRPQVFLEFNEVTRPQKGQDVSLRLKVSGKYTIYTIATPLSINISVQAMRHNGVPAANIQREMKVETLEPGKELSIPVVVPFLKYYKPMLECESMKVSAVVVDKLNPDNTYLAEDDVVLFDPPISITVAGPVRVNREAVGEVIFLNPVNLTLKDCTLSFTGSAIWKEEAEFKMPDMKPNTRIVSRFTFVPHKAGKKTLTIDFDCSVFRNIKSWCTIDVEP